MKNKTPKTTISAKAMNVLQPTLEAISNGTINKRDYNKIISLIKDTMIESTPGRGKYRITNFKSGVVTKVSTENDSGTVFLSMKDSSFKPITVKRTRNRKQYFVNPKTNQSLNHTSINQLVKDYAEGKFNS